MSLSGLIFLLTHLVLKKPKLLKQKCLQIQSKLLKEILREETLSQENMFCNMIRL